MMIAQVCGYRPGEFIHTLGDAHLYSNHLEQAKLQLSREPRNLPVMRINPEVKDLFAFRFEDFSLEGYDPTSTHCRASGCLTGRIKPYEPRHYTNPRLVTSARRT